MSLGGEKKFVAMPQRWKADLSIFSCVSLQGTQRGGMKALRRQEDKAKKKHDKSHLGWGGGRQ